MKAENENGPVPTGCVAIVEIAFWSRITPAGPAIAYSQPLLRCFSVTRTVLRLIALTVRTGAMSSACGCCGLPDGGLSTRSMLKTTELAVSGSPFWNVTPLCSANV